MQLFELSTPTETPRRLTQSVLQITEMLGMYQAELARVLGLQCGDIGELSSGRRCLELNTQAWRQALLFVEMYQALYALHCGDGVAMYHWLRSTHDGLESSPHLLMVDHHQLGRVVDHLQAQQDKTKR